MLETPKPSDYTNTDFKPFVVGNSNPLADKINPSLLDDVDEAAKRANVKVSITTAVSGHRKGSRHEKGLAVDIAMINGQGYRSENDAKKKGIYEPIMRFVHELEKMGYTKNTESGNDKAVLTFGFPQHHHHVHVSRNSDDGKSDTNGVTHTQKTNDTDTNNIETDVDQLQKKYDNINFMDKFDVSDDEFIDLIGGMLSPMVKEHKEQIIENIIRIKKLL
jgi:hypothetical protein